MWWRRRRTDEDFKAEIGAHLAHDAERHMAEGLPPDEAYAAARRAFGNVTALVEQLYEARRLLWLDHLHHDVRTAVRACRKTPGFTAVVVLTLGCSIGVSTTIVSAVDAVLLRPLRFTQPDRLMMIRPSSGSRVSSAYLDAWRQRSRLFQDFAGWRDVRVNVTGSGEPVEAMTDAVTTNFFAILGAPALLGRTLTTHRDLHQVEPEVVLSYGFWQRRYGSKREVIDQTLTIDGRTYTIVGVMPKGFGVRSNELAQPRADLWLPLALDPFDQRGILTVMARVGAGVSVEQAETELSVLARDMEAERPTYARDWRWTAVPLRDATVQDVRLALLVLFGAVAILLLIACANVGTLMLRRGVGRQAEFALRRALGATNGRLIRQVLCEAVLLALGGGLVGVLLAQWAAASLPAVIPPGLDVPRVAEISPDRRVVLVALLVTMMTVGVFGVVPAIRTASWAHLPTQGGPRRSSGWQAARVGSLAIVTQVAFALTLLVGAGLLGRSFWKLIHQAPGFQPARVLTLRTTLSVDRYDGADRLRTFSENMLARLEGLPGVLRVGFANYLPLSRFGMANHFVIETKRDARLEEHTFSWVAIVGGRYFDTMGIPLLRGRLPTVADTKQTTPVFVIDDSLARRFWPEADPIGARLTWDVTPNSALSGEVIGVVGNVRWQRLSAPPPASAYWWAPQVPVRDLTIVVLTAENPIALADPIATQIRAIDPAQPVADVRPFEDFITDDLAQARFTMLLLSGFASAALLLASMGVYGLIAFDTLQRTREVGIRVALGATPRRVVELVTRRVIRLMAIGVVVGTALALGLGRVVASLLFGITPTDPLTLGLAPLFLGAVGLTASYLPARRATRVNPMVALKDE